MQPNSAARYNFGTALLAAGKPAAAIALDILAAAQAADGQFNLAVATCDEALRLDPEASVAAAIRQRRALYARGRPYVLR